MTVVDNEDNARVAIELASLCSQQCFIGRQQPTRSFPAYIKPEQGLGS
jgi:hypothetical protein